MCVSYCTAIVLCPHYMRALYVQYECVCVCTVCVVVVVE